MKKIANALILVCAMCFAMSKVNAQLSISISVGTPPPALPVYVQPACPYDGYLWEPGYWAYDPEDGYYWVPGVWVAPPVRRVFWTPPYWGYGNGHYGFHAGYWGPHVGFYGGINYGYGYGGHGFGGGTWDGDRFRYNTAVVNVDRTVVHYTYVDRTVINNVTVSNHISFNGPGGVSGRPRPEELAAMKEKHFQPTANQLNHQRAARADRNQFAKYNGGHPAAAAMNKVGGRPVNEHGQVAANSKMGKPDANRNPKSNPPAEKRPQRNQDANRNPKSNPPAEKRPQHNPDANRNPKSNPPAEKKPQHNPDANRNPKSNPPAKNKPQHNPDANRNPKSNPPAENKPQHNPDANGNPKSNPPAEKKPQHNPDVNRDQQHSKQSPKKQKEG